MNRYFSSFLMISLLFMSSTAYAGAWLQQKDHVSVSGDWLTTKVTNDTSSSAISTHGPDYTRSDIQIRAEYGATDKTTIYVNPTYTSVTYSDGVVDSGINTIQVGARHLLWWKNNQVLSGEISVFLPGTPTLSSGTDVEARLLYGRGFQIAGMDAFIDAELGLRMRGGGQANEIRPDITFGLQMTKEMQATVSSFNVYSMGEATGTYSSIEQHKIQAGLNYALDDALSLHGGFWTTLGGLNAPTENGASFGLTNQF